MMLGRFFAAIALIASIGATPVPLTDAEQAADESYSLVRDAVTAMRPSPLIAYAVTVTYDVGQRHIVETYDSIARYSDRVISPTYIPREDAAHPHVPHGTNFAITFTMGGRTAGRILNPEFFEPFGVPVLSPSYTFGLNRSVARSARPASPQPGVIGTVRAVARDYAVQDLGDDDCAGPCRHLRLTPLHDPHRLRIRDLWIDPASHLPQRLLLAGNFDRSPMDGTRWEIAFAPSRAFGLTIESERSLEEFDIDGKTIKNAEIRFSELQRIDDIGIWHIRLLGIGGTRGATFREPDDK